MAYIVPASDIEFDIKGIYNYCRANLEDYKIPREIHTVRELRKTPSGKINRKQEIVLDAVDSCGTD